MTDDPSTPPASRPVRDVLVSLRFAPAELPSHRHAWLPEFVARTYALATMPGGGAKARERRLFQWNRLFEHMLQRGVVCATLLTVGTARDATGQEQRRYEDCGAQEQLELLAPDDVREILLDAIGAPELAAWLAHPAWFGPVEPHHLPSQRGRAVKFYPHFARWHPALAPDEIAWLERLLDDPQPVVRHCAAMVLAEHKDGPVGPKTVVLLIDAIADRDWIWSRGDRWNDRSTGCNAAAAAARKPWRVRPGGIAGDQPAHCPRRQNRGRRPERTAAGAAASGRSSPGAIGLNYRRPAPIRFRQRPICLPSGRVISTNCPPLVPSRSG